VGRIFEQLLILAEKLLPISEQKNQNRSQPHCNMSTLATVVDGLKLPNPFVIASGPPGTNLNVINRAFREGWGAVIAKTVSLDSSKVVNVTPRYGKLHANDKKEIIGWENIELISDRPLDIWIEEFKEV